MGKPMQAMTGVILAVIALWVIVEVIDAVDTSSWSSLLVTVIGTLLPAIVGIGGIFIALRAFGIVGGKGI